MTAFAMNHMAVPGTSHAELLAMAQRLGCRGVEFRNDLALPMFNRQDASAVRSDAEQRGLRIFALAEVKAFNNFCTDTLGRAKDLAELAAASGAEAVSLIPRNDGKGLGNGERQANLRIALREIKPHLDANGVKGFVEPLGFETSSLRYKEEALEMIDALGAGDTYRLVHDTFHHHIAQEDRLFPEQTGLVHVSGVVDPHPSISEMTDAHRVLVDAHDRLGNIQQLRTLREGGFRGPVSFEPFAPEVHALRHPDPAFERSIAFIASSLEEEMA